MMLDFLPAGKTCVAIKTRGFPERSGATAEYEFKVNCRNSPFILEIPGEHGGPDNCYPSSGEQEKWLDELAESPENGISRVWDCQWQLTDESALGRFLRLLEPFRIETNYY